ncbi:MAG: PQQ-binding-like beta-propeller repeat protein [Actinomycetota bacterium]|nr:PQQ-binding-like beta-propeller repeat protein [Actinomycetota bacterium]
MAARLVTADREGEPGSAGRARPSAFVGRIGALALFLGVGAALAVPGVAYADSETSAPSASSSADSSTSTDPSDNSSADSDGDSSQDSTQAGDSDADTEADELEADAELEAELEGEAAQDEAETVDEVIEEDVDDAVGEETIDLPVADDASPAEENVEGGSAAPGADPAVEVEVEVTPGSPTDAPSTPPLQSPASWAMAAYSRRELGQQESVSEPADATDVSAGEPALSSTVETDVAPAWNFPVLTAIDDFLFSLAPHTYSAVKNVLRMIVETPLQTLFDPIRSTVFAVSSVTRGVLTDIGLLPALPYADTGWVTLHGDPANRKEQLGVTPAEDYSRWEALLGAGILAAPTILPNGNIVVTTGLAAGAANLHVIDPEGNIVWESAAWSGTESVDSAAVLSSPIIDRNGNIFVSDGDQLWSYTQDGDVRWVTVLPSPPAENPFTPGSRNINSFITATLTNDGSILGVTLFGQVVVVDGETGAYTAPIYQIPGPLAQRTSTNPPPTLWAGGFMDPAIIDPIWQVAYGGIVRSANTPAVQARNGRVIVAATDAVEGLGALYAFEYVPPTPYGEGKIVLAWATQMGPGSGSSPTISNDGRLVYASDNDGFLYAFKTSNGEVVWKTQSNAEAASVAADARGNVYVLTRNNVMTSFDGDGNLRWNADVGTLLATLPVSPMWGAPVAIGAGNPTVVKGFVVQDVIVGYNVSLAPIGQNQTVFVPVKASLVAFDPVTGIAQRVLADTTEGTEGILNIAPNGMIYATIGAFTTTSLAPLAPYLNNVLPQGYSVLTPGGGVNGFIPL